MRPYLPRMTRFRAISALWGVGCLVVLYAAAHTRDGVGLNPGTDVGTKAEAANLDAFLARKHLELRAEFIDLSLELGVAILGGIDLFSLLDPVTDRIGGEACTDSESYGEEGGAYDPT